MAGGFWKPTVDGSEIRHPPVEVGSSFHYLQGFYTSQVVSRISEPSTVVVFHCLSTHELGRPN